MKNKEKIKAYIKARLPASVNPEVLIGVSLVTRFVTLRVIAHKDGDDKVSADIKIWNDPIERVPKKAINKVIKRVLQEL